MKALRALPLLLAVAGMVMLALAGIGTRFGVWHYRTGLSMLRYSAYVGIAAAVVCILALLVTRPSGGSRVALVIGLLLSALTVGVPYRFSQTVKRVPPIHDITTDMTDPPTFVAVLPLRASATNAALYAGDSVAALQRAAYPEVRPLMLPVPPLAAFDRAVAAAKAMGWEIVAGDSPSGRLEATATTTWFGFKDDVVVRIRSANSGSRVDVRSVSRVGRSDVGANAARIVRYLDVLQRQR
ncbi:DUF1499 domain-containing protein [Gemmatimonas sp.]|uniref:DUF1499 domain-containing protein n=1 Tax=Gemmatimonas sp. TaxID=1962908 RepID=UPI0039833CE6